MKLYWVSAIVQNKDDRKPWLCSMNESVLSLDKAMDVIARLKEDNTVLSEWIDVFDKDGIKQTVFHECYIDALGNVMSSEGNGYGVV